MNVSDTFFGFRNIIKGSASLRNKFLFLYLFFNSRSTLCIFHKFRK